MKRETLTMMRLLALAALTALPLMAQVPATPPQPSPMKPTQWPKLDERKLDNGMTVVLVPLPNVPKITVNLLFLAGSGTDMKLHPGIAQFTARVVTEGTASRTSRQLRDDLRSIGGEINASVDSDTTTVRGSALSDFAPRLFELIGDVVRHPSFPSAEVELARNNFLSEIEESRSQPEFVASEQLSKAVFGNDPYGFTLPQPANVSALKREDLKQYAATWYAPNNATLVVVGDMDPGAAFAAITKAFASWTKVELPKLQASAPPKREKRQITFVDRPGSVQSVIVIGAIAPPRKDPDYIALRTANMVFGGAFYSRLTRNIREQKGYTYSPYSSADTRRRAGIFYTGAAVRNEVTGPTILEMLYELDRMRVSPVTDEELQSAKTYSNGNLALEMESQSGFANRIASIYTYGLSRDFLPAFSTKLNALTPAEIQRVAAKYFDTYRGAIVIVGDYSKVKDQVAPFGDVTVIGAK
jgi:zinc protease